jgi:TolB protein
MTAVLAALAAATLSQVPVIEISNANFRPMPLAVAPPIVQDPGAKAAVAELDESLMFDLSATGIFQLLDRKSFLADTKEGITASSINFARWSDVGAESLVKTQVALADGNIRADLRVFTVATGKEDLKVSQEMPPKDARRLAHALADAIFKFFTHEPGSFESHIAYSRSAGGNKDIWLADWDGRRAMQVTEGGLNLLPAIGRDGASVAYTSYRSGKPDIYFQRPGSKPASIVKAGQMATGAAFSPDGRRLAYSLATGDNSAQIWVAKADGSDAKVITNTPFFINSSPSWSPDGKQLAFVSNRGGTPQIYIMGADGSNARRITFQGNYNQTPDWSPRGDLIAFTARDERAAFDLFAVNVDTGKVTRLTQDQGNNEEPSFAPNGRLIVFQSDRAGAWHLYVMTTDGTTQLPLPEEKGEYSTPSWGP